MRRANFLRAELNSMYFSGLRRFNDEAVRCGGKKNGALKPPLCVRFRHYWTERARGLSQPVSWLAQMWRSALRRRSVRHLSGDTDLVTL